MVGTTPACENLARRIAFDLRKGRTTSQAARDFIRRTCPCGNCSDARAMTRLLVRTAPVGVAEVA